MACALGWFFTLGWSCAGVVAIGTGVLKEVCPKVDDLNQFCSLCEAAEMKKHQLNSNVYYGNDTIAYVCQLPPTEKNFLALDIISNQQQSDKLQDSMLDNILKELKKGKT